MTLYEELIVTVVDKAIIGLIVLIAGFWLNRALERFKSSQAMTNEFTKQRVAKIAEVWEALYKYEAEMLEYSHLIRRAVYMVEDNDLTIALERYISKGTDLKDVQSENTLTLIDRSRFWLGNDLYGIFYKYSNVIRSHAAYIFERPRNATNSDSERNFLDQLDALKKSIFDYLK
jgi:hypothetical protein